MLGTYSSQDEGKERSQAAQQEQQAESMALWKIWGRDAVRWAVQL